MVKAHEGGIRRKSKGKGENRPERRRPGTESQPKHERQQQVDQPDIEHAEITAKRQHHRRNGDGRRNGPSIPQPGAGLYPGEPRPRSQFRESTETIHAGDALHRGDLVTTAGSVAGKRPIPLPLRRA